MPREGGPGALAGPALTVYRKVVRARSSFARFCRPAPATLEAPGGARASPYVCRQSIHGFHSGAQHVLRISAAALCRCSSAPRPAPRLKLRAGIEEDRQGSRRRQCFESTDLTTTNPRPRPPTIRSPACRRSRSRPHRSRRDRAERGQASADHEGRSGRADPGPHRLRPDGPGAVPVAAAGRLERPPRRRRRVRHAQRVQRRFRVERLRRPEGIRLRVAEQGRAQPPVHDRHRPVGLPPQSRVAALREVLR